MTKSNAKSALSKIRIPSAKSSEQTVNRKHLHLVRDELKSDIRSLDLKMESRFDKMESRFSGIDSRFDKMESRFSGIDSRFDKMESRFHGIDSNFKAIDSRFNDMESKMEKILSEVSRMSSLIEEQRSDNRMVLEGYQALWQRQERIEKAIR